MSDIAGVGSVNADVFRPAAQNDGRQAQSQVQIDQEGENIADRRVERAEQGARSNDDLERQPDFSLDDVRQNAVNADSEQRQDRAVAIEDDVQVRVASDDNAFEVTLSDAAQRAQQQANRIATRDTGEAQQNLLDGIQETESGLDADDFTRIIDQNRERDSASSSESRATRELGRVIDTFA